MNPFETAQPKALLKDINFYNINLLSFLCTISSVLSPAFPAISKHFNISPDQMGLFVTVNSAAVIISSLFMGVLADRIGRKKVLLISLLIFLVFGLLCVFSTSYTMMLVFVFLAFLGMPALLTLPSIIAGDLYRGNQRIQAMGIINASAQAGLAVFPLLGGFLVTISWFCPFLIFALALPAAVLALIFFEEPQIPKSEESFGNYIKAAFICYGNKKILSLAVLSIALDCALSGCYIIYMPFLIMETTESASLIGISMSVMALTSVGSGVALGPLSKKVSLENLIRIAFLLIAVSFVMVLQIHTPNDMFWVFLSNGIFGLGIGLALPAFFALYINSAPGEIRGAFMSIVSFVNKIGDVLGPVLSGVIYIKWGLHGVFSAAAILCAAALCFSAAFVRKGSDHQYE